jgi:fructan beta-fructosidase
MYKMEKRIKILEQDKYLVFPIKAKQDKAKIYITKQNEIITELNIPVGKDENGYSYDFLAYLPLSSYNGMEITLSGEVPVAFMEAVHTADSITRKRNQRPSIHFTPDYGWINDPNGLVYQNGIYHLFFQYNPFDTEWDNMSWGHAVSADLLHWEQRDITLLPDEDGMIFSGCGLVNEFGLLDLWKDTLLFFYSAAGGANELSIGKDFSQKLAYSLDNGNTLIKKQTILPVICKENRDPKIFWHEPSKAYIMLLWLEHNDFAIFRSTNLEHWEMSQRLTLQLGFECPDLFELPIQRDIGHGECMESKWVFWSADGFYFVGDFNGYEFHTDGLRKEAYQTKLPYAAQTFSNTGNRVISIPWLRTKTIDHLYTGCMGIPREFSLVEYEGGLRLKQGLVKEVDSKQNLIFENNQSGEIHLHWNREGAVKIDLKFAYGMEHPTESFWLCLLGEEIRYDAKKGILTVSDQIIEVEKNSKDFCIIIDKGIIEITANNDTIYAVFQVSDKNDNHEIAFHSAWLDEIRVYEVL